MPDQAWNWTLETSLPSKRGAHLNCMQEIMEELRKHGWEGRDLFGIEMSLEETLSNAIRHGNQYNEHKLVDVQCKLNTQRFWLRVKDQGAGFDPNQVPDCTAEENLEACGGRGVMLIQAFMSKVEFNECGNCVTMEKIRSPE